MRQRITIIAASIVIALATLQTAVLLTMVVGAHTGMGGMDISSTCPISGTVVCLQDISGVLHHVGMVQDMFLAVGGTTLALAALAFLLVAVSFVFFDSGREPPLWRMKRCGEFLHRALKNERRWLALHARTGFAPAFSSAHGRT